MIAVLGSINMDFVSEVDRFPRVGETITAMRFSQFYGGKGANQAVACARLGSDSVMYGKVGDDELGDQLSRNLIEQQVCVRHICRETACSSGIATIWVDSNGENEIVVHPGANGRVNNAYVKTIAKSVSDADILLLQLEIPIQAIAEILRLLPRRHPRVILDPAPVVALNTILTDRVEFLLPNEQELDMICAEGTSREILGCVPNILCTKGAKGVDWHRGDEVQHFPAHQISPVDTTGAGDAFAGGFAVALEQGKSIEDSIAWGQAAGALASMSRGAQQSLPTRDCITSLLKKSV